jgi:hypothetical protein
VLSLQRHVIIDFVEFQQLVFEQFELLVEQQRRYFYFADS